jgi:uncharacterized protein
MSAAPASLPQNPVTDTSRSPHARLRGLPVSAVTLEDRFWAPRIRRNREVTIPAQHARCEGTGRIDNFRRAAGKRPDLPFQGLYFNDSDVYKWLEAAAFSLGSHPDAELRATVDAVAREIAEAQDTDGYLNTYFTFERVPERWTNLADLHELYCAGHLFQAAIAHFRATGERVLLDVACRFADHIGRVFGPQARAGTCGHPEIEMALVELSRATGERRYLEMASFFVDQRGRKPPVAGGSAYMQDHLPFRDLPEMVGHAVRMVYLNAGAADLYAETGEPALLSTLERLWTDMGERKLYLTGGLGARYEGEAFGAAYELPNERAYAESCAGIGNAMWCWRMLALTADARFADMMELSLYNNVLAGISLDGTEYFYQNPLADAGGHRRQGWFGCACCPPNIARTLASLPGYVYGVAPEGVYVHLYAIGRASVVLADGHRVVLEQETAYPWDGEVRVRVASMPEGAAEFSIHMRVPGWCEAAGVAVNDVAHAAEIRPASYLAVHREWRAGDELVLRLDMPVRRVEAHPWATANHGRVALMRGPLVYCVEQADHEGVDVRDLLLPMDAPFTATHEDQLLGGVTVLRAPALSRDRAAWTGRLYRPAGAGPEALRRPARLAAIPYYAWANRAPGPMQVWLPTA